MRSKVILACVTACPLLLGASEPVRIQPSSKWVLDYANDSCRLIRRFGEGKDVTRLVFESVAPGGMTMLIIGGTLRPHAGAGEVKARLLPGLGEPFIGTSADAQNGETGAAFWKNIPLTPGWKDRLKKFDARDYAIRKPITQADRDEARTTREGDQVR
jgi:hypothetical protein